jgi:hypothetical protein
MLTGACETGACILVSLFCLLGATHFIQMNLFNNGMLMSFPKLRVLEHANSCAFFFTPAVLFGRERKGAKLGLIRHMLSHCIGTSRANAHLVASCAAFASVRRIGRSVNEWDRT